MSAGLLPQTSRQSLITTPTGPSHPNTSPPATLNDTKVRTCTLLAPFLKFAITRGILMKLPTLNQQEPDGTNQPRSIWSSILTATPVPLAVAGPSSKR